MIITIGGSIGSGKTTLAKELALRFNLRHVSAGVVMRDMAEKMRMSIGEFSKYAESNPEVDLEVDNQQKGLAKEGDCVVDGRLSGHFLDSDIRIWLKAPLDVRVDRISQRDGKTKEDAKISLMRREESERKRYREIYGINLDDLDIYDLVINTGKFDVGRIVEIISAAIKNS